VRLSFPRLRLSPRLRVRRGSPDRGRASTRRQQRGLIEADALQESTESPDPDPGDA